MTTQTLTRTKPDTLTDAPRKRLFTRKEYHAMGKAGIFAPNERVELLKGEIIVMSPVGNRHAFCVDSLNYEFAALNISRRAIVRVQNPAATSPTSEPEPDLMLMAYKDDRYLSGHPNPQDILLLVEVADSSLGYDTNVKLRHYAQSGSIRDLDSRPQKRSDCVAYRTFPGGLSGLTNLPARRNYITNRVPRLTDQRQRHHPIPPESTERRRP